MKFRINHQITLNGTDEIQNQSIIKKNETRQMKFRIHYRKNQMGQMKIRINLQIKLNGTDETQRISHRTKLNGIVEFQN